MKQLSFFECSDSKSKWTLFVDGASRGNPGSSGAGICLMCGKEVIIKKGFFLGQRTNNEAEYIALLLGIYFFKQASKESLLIKSDSELLVKQMLGVYRVKKLELKSLYERVLVSLKGIEYKICHIPREENSLADKMANVGIDKKIRPPEEFLAILKHE